ncbi:Arabinanase/levansucrase/invertase [Cyathus striatus]|nr:Arabinanase/levansucrase/invertase [Cyathus striatus]
MTMFKPLYILLFLCFHFFLVFGFQNPIKATDGSDPFIVFHEGYYYLTTTTWTNIQITRATTIGGLKTASPKVVWIDSTSSRCCNVWAPEIHWRPTEGAWYILHMRSSYYSAGTSGTFDNQRIHALKGSATTIWESTWTRITIPNRDVWSIDATVMVLGSTRYLVYSSWDGDSIQMNSATTVGDAVKISTPTYSWEKVGANVNEGPALLYHDGRTFLVFSASNCAGTGYTLGRLELTGSNPLSASSWTKYSNAIFVSANGYPGHNGFFLSPSGNEIHMVYHASSTSPGTCDGNRYTMVQQVGWHSDGTPNLGSPRALSDNVPEPK